jgi:hypothetical protein
MTDRHASHKHTTQEYETLLTNFEKIQDELCQLKYATQENTVIQSMHEMKEMYDDLERTHNGVVSQFNQLREDFEKQTDEYNKLSFENLEMSRKLRKAVSIVNMCTEIHAMAMVKLKYTKKMLEDMEREKEGDDKWDALWLDITYIKSTINKVMNYIDTVEDLQKVQ